MKILFVIYTKYTINKNIEFFIPYILKNLPCSSASDLSLKANVSFINGIVPTS